jgi:hypothetical protein
VRQNYFIFIVTRENILADHKIGDIGAGKIDTCVGIKDAPYGVFMVAPASYIQKRALSENKSPVALSSEQIKDYVFDFWNHKSDPKKAATPEEAPVVWVRES